MKTSTGLAPLSHGTRCLAFTALLVLVSSSVRAAIVIDPLAWGLNPGDTFRLVMVTAGGTSATSSSIATYDTFVNSQGLAGITYNGATLNWQALALTPDSNPVTDSSRYSSQANASLIYNLNGNPVSNTTAARAFWRTTGPHQHLNAIDWTINSSGNLEQVGGFREVWTGFDDDGSRASARNYDSSGMQIGTVTTTLGQSVAYNDYVEDFETMTGELVPKTLYPSVGRAGAVFNGWAWAYDANSLDSLYSMYAMSDIITVTAVPEPGTSSMLILAVVGIGAHAWRRRA
jgi:hypothetical protein